MKGTNALPMQLIPFDRSRAHLVLSWPRTPQELSYWAALSETPPLTIFGEWLADADSYGWLLVSDVPVAYGGLWVAEADDEVELAHILVSPHHRNQGVGRKLVRLLVEEAVRGGVSNAWVRVVPENQPAIHCYSAAGFTRASDEVQSELNAPQPRDYCWLYRRLRSVGAS